MEEGEGVWIVLFYRGFQLAILSQLFSNYYVVPDCSNKLMFQKAYLCVFLHSNHSVV